MSDQGEVIADETVDVVVHFSSSDETECIPQLKDHILFYCPIPDFMTEALFIDFLTEIADTISDEDTDRFIQLFDPFSSLWDELQRWNKRRVKWFDSETTCPRIRDTCKRLNERSVRDFIFPSPLEGDIKSVDILINNEIDPARELRRIINQLIASTKLASDAESDADEEIEEALDTSVDDDYALDEEEEIDEEVQANPEKPCYYPSQIEMAAILKKRIDTIMFHYHNVTSLSDVFKDVEFVVYTARYRMLSDQTEKRIRHPDAGVLSKEELKSRDHCHAKKRMFMYVHSTETEKHFQELKRDVQEQPDTLFVVIADECHWGITKDKEDKKPSAHNLFVNEWCREDTPKNVIVVQISATPFNLLTQNSRLPFVRCALLNDNVSTLPNDYKAGDLVVLEREPNLDEDVKNNSKEVELHVVHWSEVELKNFERGMRMKLKSVLSINDAPYQYLCVSPDGKLGVTSVEEAADYFIVQGSHGIVTLKVTKEQQQGRPLTVNQDALGNLEATFDPEKPTKFEVKLDFGVGVVAFCSCEKQDQYIAVDEHGYVSLQAAKVERKCGVSIMKAAPGVARLSTVSYQFFIDQSGPAEVDLVGQHYKSLNAYLSTMNCSNKHDQKIRQDENFQKMVDKSKRQKKMCNYDSPSFSPDALLCAEYCYHVLHASVYCNDEDVRRALTSSVDESPAAEFNGKFDEFVRKLEKQTKNPKKCIEPEALAYVYKELCDKAKQDFNNTFKERTRLLKQNERQSDLKEVNEELCKAFVVCLLHLSQHEMQNIKEDPRKRNVVEEIEQTLRNNNCQEMVQYWHAIVQEGETTSLVQNLIHSGKGKMGKMKIVRAKSMKTADQFYFTLRLARLVAFGEHVEDSFEVIRDYGGIQIEKQLMRSSNPFFHKLQPAKCSDKFDCCCNEYKPQDGRKKCGDCQHVHKVITQYEDLENLACVLILVEKGRMGDTFPQSFNCLDLRLSYDSSSEFKEGSSLYLSTVIQELGRMCRYSKSPINEGPYVLVGRALFKKLQKSLETSPSVSAISCNKADRYMTKSTKRKDERCSSLRWLDYEAHKDSYDYQNVQMYCNRLLLQAEPQIGKTGTYLCLIRDLRLDILGKENVPLSSVPSFDKEIFYQEKEYYPSEELVVSEPEERQDWQFPYWKTIQNSPSLHEKPVASGKYSINGCFYTHDMEESPYILLNPEQKAPTKSVHQYQTKGCADRMRAWHWYHFEKCAECARLLQGKDPVSESFDIDIDGRPVSVNVSIPNSWSSFKHLLQKLKNQRSTQEAGDDLNTLSLPYWIFHASHRDDPRKCTLNYHHVMQENGHIHSYVQIVVVRKEKFHAYKSTWGKVLAVIQLPDELPNCTIDPDAGGVGYARMLIQKMAYALNQEYVFMIDDNVVAMSEAEFSTGDKPETHGRAVIRDEHGVMKMQRCSFLKPLRHLQKITQGKDIPAIDEGKYEPHPLKEEFKSQELPLYSYTGPAKLFGNKQHESYGILGLIRSIPVAVNPFSKTQVYAAILLNVKSTVEKGVLYRPWPCWEDLRFNDDCDKAGLWVVKCNRFSFLKVQYKDWMTNLALPKIFEWKDDSILEEKPPPSELPKDLEEAILLEYLRNVVNVHGPEKRFKGSVGYDPPESIEEKVSPVRIVQQVEAKEELDEASKIPVLVLSYSVTNRAIRNLMLLHSIFCKTEEEIVLVTSAKETIERWPRMTKATVEKQICLSDEMQDRNAQFSILSAADPKRHLLRYILIKASFLKNNENAQEEILTSRVENNLVQIGNGLNVEEGSAPCNYEPIVDESTFSHDVQPISSRRKPIKRSLQESLDNIIEIKRQRMVEDSSESVEKERCDLKSSPSGTKLPEDAEIEKKKSDSTDKDDEEFALEKMDSSDSDGEENEVLGNGSYLVRKKPEAVGGGFEQIAVKQLDSSDSGEKEYEVLRSSGDLSISNEDQVTWSRKQDARNEDPEHTEGNINQDNEIASLNSTDEEETEPRNVDYNAEECEEAASGCNVSTPSGSQLCSGRKRESRIQKSAYVEGTNDVTKSIVDLWWEYRNLPGSNKTDNEDKGSSDLTMEYVKEKLGNTRFTIQQLQAIDDRGYTALLKACSLPSMSPHVIQYLITTRKVDINCRLPDDFDRNHSTPEGLIAGMSALTVAIKSGNVKRVSTFTKSRRQLAIGSADDDGNTALHHSVITKSISSFKMLFPLFKTLKWDKLRNKDGKSPLDIAKSMEGRSEGKKKAITTMLTEMKNSKKGASQCLEKHFSPKPKVL